MTSSSSSKNPPFLPTDGWSATLFDLFSESSLRSSLKPAWEFLCRSAASKYPKQLSCALKYTDEIFYAFLLVMEEYNLRHKSASLTETFYQLKRECTVTPSSLRFRHAKLLSLLSLVALPYLQDKIERRYQEIKERVLSNDVSISQVDMLLFHWYPVLTTLSKWLRIANYVLFLFKYSKYPYPLFKILGLQLKYDMDSFSSSYATSVSANEGLLWKTITTPIDIFASCVTRIAPLMFYSLSFLEMFYQQDMTTQNPMNMLAGAMVPPDLPKIVSTAQLPESKKQCPLCLKRHVRPATLTVSGFVFCYQCLYMYVSRHGCCPITYRPSAPNDIIVIHHQ